MIERPNLILFGRAEPIVPETATLRQIVDLYVERAKRAWLGRWPDRAELWRSWNVLALIGPFRRWNYVDLLTYEGLGERATPHLTSRLRYIPMIDHIGPVEVDLEDPPVLHRSWRLLPKPGDGRERGRQERLRRLDKKLGSLVNAPEAQTRLGFERLLRLRRLQVVDELMARHSRRGAANAGALDLPGTTVAVVRTGLQPLREAMDEVFACETAYGICKPQAPSAGHCILAAMVVQDLYGGELIKGSFGNMIHYWNRISPFDIDLTGDQFGCARVRVKRGRLNGGGSVFPRVAGQQLNQPFNGKVCGKYDTFVLALLPVLGRHGLNDYVSRIARCQVGAS